MDTITSELPALGGYAVVVLGILALAGIQAVAQRAHRNAVKRRARRRVAELAAQHTPAAQADVDAWLDYPQGGTR